MNKIQAVLDKFSEKFSALGIKLSVEATQEKQMVEGVLADGTKIFTNADAFGEGVDVFAVDAEGNKAPLPDGEYTLPEGDVLVVIDGLVKSISPAIVEAPEEMNAVTAEEVEATIASIVQSFEQKLSEKVDEINAVKAELASVKAELSKAPAASSVRQSSAQKVTAPKSTDPLTVKGRDRAMVLINQFKNK